MGRDSFASSNLREPQPLPFSQQSVTTLSPETTATLQPNDDSVDRLGPASSQAGSYTTAQDRLRQASQNLDAAFDRLRELRRSLTNMSSQELQPQSSTLDFRPRVGPSHAAIVLSEPTNSHPSSTAHVSEFRNFPTTWPQLGPFRFIARNVEDLPSTSQDMYDEVTYPFPPLAAHPPAQWRLTSRVQPQASNEPSTSLGRRVAARQAGETPSAGASRTHSRTISVAEVMRAARRQREPRTAAVTPAVTAPAEGADFSSSAASLRALRDSRDRMRAEARVISNRTSPHLPRPDEIEADPAENRNYRVRRRLNADGDELVYNININQDSSRFEDPTWDVFPRRRLPTLGFPLADPVDNSTSITTPPQPADNSVPIEESAPAVVTLPTIRRRVQSRRRGWARLDADGNEIPTDEEEALERTRAQNRIRDQEQSHSNIVMFQMVRDRMDRIEDSRRFIPTTQAPAPEDGPDPRVRVRINASTAATELSIPDEQKYSPPREQITPFVANPLPMPLEDMLDSSCSKHQLSYVNDMIAVKVSRSAQFAGR